MYVRTRSIPSDTLTPVAAYRAVASPGASCLLESVDGRGPISRYSFVGCDYLDTRTFAGSSAMFDEIREFVRLFRPPADGANLGGALIVLAYDAARSLARLPPRAPSEPEIPDAYVAIASTWLVFDHHRHSLTLWGCGSDEREIARRLDSVEKRLFQTRPFLPEPIGAASAVRQSLERAQYLALVARVKDYILEGECYQLQLGIRFSAALSGAAFDLYRALRAANPSPYMFYVDAGFGQVLGASPEFLVRLEGERARIRPLAGTRPRGRDAGEDAANARDLLANAKEVAEHIMLVDLARNDLGAVGKIGSVRVDELLQIERFSHVMHIVSNVQAELRPEADALSLLAAAFPAGTVTGTPKIRAMQIVDALEPVRRGAYAGSVGRLSFGGDLDSCITLRSVHVRDDTAYWQASAGIVADSDPQSEYDEIFHKTRIVREVLGL